MSFSNLTVGELRTALEQYDDETVVIISTDSEGSAFTPLVDITSGHFISETDYSGDFVSEDDVDDDEDLNLDGAVAAITLWPAN